MLLPTERFPLFLFIIFPTEEFFLSDLPHQISWLSKETTQAQVQNSPNMQEKGCVSWIYHLESCLDSSAYYYYCKVMTMHPTVFPNLFTDLHKPAVEVCIFNAFHILFLWCFSYSHCLPHPFSGHQKTIHKSNEDKARKKLLDPALDPAMTYSWPQAILVAKKANGFLGCKQES